MSRRTARVLLGELVVGDLVEDDAGYIEFKISQQYRDMPRRPVLGQWFEDHRHRNQRGDRPGDLPAFFDNLIPEGDLRLRLEDRLGIAPADDFGFLIPSPTQPTLDESGNEAFAQLRKLTEPEVIKQKRPRSFGCPGRGC